MYIRKRAQERNFLLALKMRKRKKNFSADLQNWTRLNKSKMNEINKHKNYKLAISFPEILVAVLVFSILAFPIYSFLIQTRKDTLKTINYLRAMELAQEGLDWVKITPIKK